MRIKRLNEQQYFAHSFSGDGYNTSNGVFRVQYKPYNDLSVSRGRESIPFHYIKGQEFQIGDQVKARIKGSEENVHGKIVSMNRDEHSKEYRFSVKSDKTNKIFPVISSTMEMVKDTGFASASRTANVDLNRGKMALNMKYNHGGLVWGKLESKTNKNGDILLTNNGQTATRKGVLDNSITLSVISPEDKNVNLHHPNFQKLGIAYLDTKSRTIFIDSSNPDFQRLSDDHLIAIEAHEIAHNMIRETVKENIEIICDLVAARLLRNKGYNSSYKIIVSNFLGRHKNSYGDYLDQYNDTLDNLMK